MMNYLNVDRVAFSIKGYDVYWYGIIICCAIILAVLVATFYAKKKGYDSDMPLNIALVVVPTGILGARLFSVLFDSSLNFSDFFNFRTGGLSIIGGVICGAIGLLTFCLIKRDKDIFKYFDVLAVVLILAQAIGRWGNYFNEEVYGRVINADSLFARFPFAVMVDGQYYMALFFYEFCLNIFGFIMLSSVYFGSRKNGYTTALYLLYYGLVRTILEPLRQAEYILMWNGMQISRIISVLMMIIGFVIYLVIAFKSAKQKKVK